VSRLTRITPNAKEVAAQEKALSKARSDLKGEKKRVEMYRQIVEVQKEANEGCQAKYALEAERAKAVAYMYKEIAEIRKKAEETNNHHVNWVEKACEDQKVAYEKHLEDNRLAQSDQREAAKTHVADAKEMSTQAMSELKETTKGQSTFLLDAIKAIRPAATTDKASPVERLKMLKEMKEFLSPEQNKAKEQEIMESV
jgi:hypothetical protein